MIVLEKLQEQTVETKLLLREWRNQEYVRAASLHDKIISVEEHKNWLEKIEKDIFNIIFVVKEDNIPFGVVQLNHINYNDLVAYTSAYILKDVSPLGGGIIAEKLLNDYAFGELKLKVLKCEVLSNNKRVLKFNKMLGYQETGIEKTSILRNNEIIEVINMELSLEEWEKHRLLF